jgi:hypothetical protein
MGIIIFMIKRKNMAMITLMNIAEEVRRKILMSKQHFYTLWVI